jgi:nucleotide sugar dehydrogenase
MSLISAEMTKLATNCFLTTKIAFANAIGDIARKAGAEPEKILAAIGADSRIGTKYLSYGFGYGGPCFPRDNKAFTHFAGKAGCNMLISEATDQANEAHHHFLTEQWLKDHEQQEEILFDSVTYKKGSDILEASQQLKLAEALARSGKKVIIRESPDVIRQLIGLYGNLFSYQVHGN